MSNFPLLDGSEIDLDRELDSYPDVDAHNSVVLREDFAREDLPWWLTYETDNGPASPTIDGLVTSGGETTSTLSTGTTSVDDVTTLNGPTINWSNWQEVRFYVYGFEMSATNDSVAYLSLASDRVVNTQEAFRATVTNERYLPRIRTGGSDRNNADTPVDLTNKISFGARLYDHGGGHSLSWILNGQTAERWSEGQGFPAEQDLTFYAGVQTKNTGADRTITIDGIYLELIPY